MRRGNQADDLPEKEKARIRHRDRKRETRMVVDNAGVRRLLPAIEEQRTRKRRQPDETS